MLRTAKPLMPFPRPVALRGGGVCRGHASTDPGKRGVCVCPQVCVCEREALGPLQPGALTGLSRPEAVQPVSRMAGGIPGPEASRAGPAGAGRTGGGSLADPLHLVLSISPQVLGVSGHLRQSPSWRNLSCFIFEGCGFGLPWQWMFRARLQGIRQLWRCLGLLVTAEGQASVAEPLVQECLWAP